MVKEEILMTHHQICRDCVTVIIQKKYSLTLFKQFPPFFEALYFFHNKFYKEIFYLTIFYHPVFFLINFKD